QLDIIFYHNIQASFNARDIATFTTDFFKLHRFFLRVFRRNLLMVSWNTTLEQQSIKPLLLQNEQPSRCGGHAHFR
uniref:Uncharacterized protein n=1 Tax=Acrobeloides nanus TaxID=290746 RepID=A0A914DFR2_9BILA